MSVKQGSTYLACSSEAYTDGVCEPGASATDGSTTEGDLTRSVSCAHIHGASHLHISDWCLERLKLQQRQACSFALFT